MATKIVVDCSTGETTEVELTAEEVAEVAAAQALAEAQRLAFEAEEAAKAESKASAQAKLAKLGLSEAEIAALVS